MLFTLVILAVVQGLTEFLPVSSSGHLNLISHFFALDASNMLLFFLIVHAGTACAALFYFRKDIIDIILGFFDFITKKDTPRVKDAFKWSALVLTVSLPTGIIGITLKSHVEQLGTSLSNLGIALVVTAFILLATKYVKTKNLDLHSFGYKEAFLVGLAQSFALMPGISRSGSTIAMALILGATPLFAGKLSFLASFVAIFGALLLEVLEYMKEGKEIFPISYLIISFIVSFLVGLFALRFLMKILSHGKLYLFSLYCGVLGLTVLIYNLIKL
jgi:undecaprenyl-diphosphatase